MMAELPSLMTAIEITEPGGAYMLRPAQRAVPEPKEGVKFWCGCARAGVNRPDVLQQQGQYAPPPGASDIPGLEIAGDIVARGHGSEAVQEGRSGRGPFGWRWLCQNMPWCMKAMRCRCHQGFGYIEAAAIPETFFTVWHNVFERGWLKEGEVFLVHGGSSGIGTTAIQLAKAFGATVITTAGSKEKCDACVKLGADRAINYHEEDFVAVVKEMTGGKGVDVILDMVGGDYVERNYKAAAEDGRIMQIAFLNGGQGNGQFRDSDDQAADPYRLHAAPAPGGVQGGYRQRTGGQGLAASGAAPCRACDGYDFSLKDAWRAHERMEEGRHIGKIVLDIA